MDLEKAKRKFISFMRYENKYKWTNEMRFIFFVFWILPALLFFLLFIPYSGTGRMIMDSSGGMIKSPEIYHYERFSGQITIQQMLDQDSRYYLYLFLGRTLDLPVISVCFSNDGTQYPIVISSFNSSVVINNDKINIGYNNSECYDLDPDTNKFDYEWTTEYKYDMNATRKLKDTIDSSNPFIKNIELVENETNIIFLFVPFLLVYWGMCWLISRVIIITKRGFEL